MSAKASPARLGTASATEDPQAAAAGEPGTPGTPGTPTNASSTSGQAGPPRRSRARQSEGQDGGARPQQGQTGRSRPGRPRAREAARTQAELLDIATQEFARLGYFGARVDEIADKSSTTKRMIYYYFGDKDGLFTAVLEKAYADIRAAERQLDLSDLPPQEAMRALIEHTFRWHFAHPELARLVTSENSLDAAHLRASVRQAGLNLPIITLVDDILARGREDGVFVRDVDGVDLHLMMSALALFQVTNAPTINATFGVRMDTEQHLEHSLAMVTSMVCTWLSTPEP